MALPTTPSQGTVDSARTLAVDQIQKGIGDAISILEQLRTPHLIDQMHLAAQILTSCFSQKGKLIVAGNGGSLCDAMHMAEELTGYFRYHRPALAALALSDPGHLSCVANDVGYEHVFARGIEAHGKKGDVFAGLTTSGNSINLVRAFKTARECQMKTIAFLGKEGGELRGMADVEIFLKGPFESDRIQEAHMTAIHLIIEMCEHALFGKVDHAKLA